MYKKNFQNNSYAEVEHSNKTIIYKTFTSDGKKTSEVSFTPAQMKMTSVKDYYKYIECLGYKEVKERGVK